MGQDIAETKLGSPVTMAYELLTASSENTIYNSKADLWSIGIVYYQLLFGQPPFIGFSTQQHLADIKAKANGNLCWPKDISTESKDILTRILVTDPNKRLDWDQFFNHKLFKIQLFKNPLHKVGSLQTMVDYQFKENCKNNKNTNNVKFMEDKDIIEYNNGKKINAILVDDTLTNDTINDLSPQMLLDNLYRYYSNYLESVNLLMYTAKLLYECAKREVYKAVKYHLMNAVVLLVKKGLALVNYNLDNLARGTNNMGISNSLQKEFMTTAYYAGLHHSFKLAKDNLENLMQFMITKCKKDDIKLKYITPVNSKQNYRIILNASLDSLSSVLKKFILNMSNCERDLKVARVLLDSCIEVEFKYGVYKVNTCIKKFTCNLVKQKVEGLDKNQLDKLVT